MGATIVLPCQFLLGGSFKMKARVTLVIEREITEIPKSCNLCVFSDHCDGVIADMSKRGNQWKVAYTRKRANNCPLVVVEDSDN